MLWVSSKGSVDSGAMLCDPADLVAGLPNMPLTLTLILFPDDRMYIVCSFAPCDYREISLADCYMIMMDA
jgi:hypothetical protein